MSLDHCKAIKAATATEGAPALEELLFNATQLQDCAEVRSTWSDACSCASCKGAVVKNLDVPSNKKCKWQRAHFSFMKRHELCQRSVASRYNSLVIGTPRKRHLIAIVLERNKNLSKQGRRQITLVNMSQSINRCTMSTKDHLMVLTPGGQYYHVALNRILAAEEAFLLMGFDMAHLDVGSLSAGEIASLAGNAMHVRMIAVAMLVGFSIVDMTKFSAIVAKKNSQTQRSKLTGA